MKQLWAVVEARTTDRFETELNGCLKKRSDGGSFAGDVDAASDGLSSQCPGG